jgi:2,3-dihydroxybenzoate decarboxylase
VSKTVRRIALEEAFWPQGLRTRGASTDNVSGVRSDVAQRWKQRLGDFTEYRLPEMDRYGIDMQVLSLTSPGLQMQPDPAIAVDDARRANDMLAGTVAGHPARFAGLAALPLQDPAKAVGELDRAVTQLGLRGALVNDHTLGHYLDEPQFDIVWERLEALHVPLYIHPGAVPADRWHVFDGYPALSGPIFGWAAATGAHLLRLVYGRVFDRHPEATVILGHLGEFLPFQLARLDARHADLALDQPPAMKPSEYLLRNVMITTSGVCSAAALMGVIGAIGIDNVMFAVDYPYESTAEAVAFLDSAPLADQDRARVAHVNAERILRLH